MAVRGPGAARRAVRRRAGAANHRHEQHQRWPEAIRCAERLVARDPLREESHRLLIRLCQASGDRARAVRAYHVCATTLERELGVDPAPETRAVYESLVVAALADRIPGTPPLVGRAAERARLAAAWRAAASGHPRLVLVTGEAGVGKTRLVDDLRARAAAVTAEARGYPAEGPLAYGVATAWLRSAPVAARLSRLGRPDLTELARLLPELAAPGHASRTAARGGVAAPAARRDRPRAAGRGRAAAARRGRRAVGRRPVAAPDPLPDPLRTASRFVAATARREELDEHHPLTALTTAVAALGRLTEIELARLSREETARLAEHITRTPPGPAGLERLYRDSEGNPLFVVEALRPDAPAARQVQAVITSSLRPGSRRRPPPRPAWPRPSGRRSPRTSWPPPPGWTSRRSWPRWTSCGAAGSSARTARTPTTSATAGSGTPPTPRSARPAGGTCTSRSRGRSSAASTRPRRRSRRTTSRRARPRRPSAGTSGRRRPPSGCTRTPTRCARWSGRWRCPASCRTAPVPPGSSSGCSDIPVKPTTSATSPCRPRAGLPSHAYSRAAAEVWAAIVAIDRGEVAEIRRHARALSAGPADETLNQVRLAARALRLPGRS